MGQTLNIHTEFIRLQDVLKAAGLAGTGGQAKLAIQQGLVRVNGEICTMRGKKCRPEDTIVYNGEEIAIQANA